jgi:hypothetical protein
VRGVPADAEVVSALYEDGEAAGSKRKVDEPSGF